MNFFYRFDYDDHIIMADQRACPMIFNANTYAAAEFYDVQHLKRLASRKFKIATENGWQRESALFAKAIAVVYETTPDSDRVLREIVLDISSENLNQLLECSEFRNVLSEHGEFGLDLLQATSRKSKKFECVHCQFKFKGDAAVMRLQNVSCPKCGRRKLSSSSGYVGIGSFESFVPANPFAQLMDWEDSYRYDWLKSLVCLLTNFRQDISL